MLSKPYYPEAGGSETKTLKRPEVRELEKQDPVPDKRGTVKKYPKLLGAKNYRNPAVVSREGSQLHNHFFFGQFGLLRACIWAMPLF